MLSDIARFARGRYSQPSSLGGSGDAASGYRSTVTTTGNSILNTRNLGRSIVARHIQLTTATDRYGLLALNYTVRIVSPLKGCGGNCGPGGK